MTKEKFLLLTEEKKVKACKVASFKELLAQACKEQARFHSCNFDTQTAMYRVYKQAVSKPRKEKVYKPLYHTVTSNMLIRAMHDTCIPREEKLL